MGVFAAGTGHRIAIKAETAWGTGASGTGFQTIRHTSCNIKVVKDIIKSKEIRNDRQTATPIHGFKKVQGDIGFELSSGSFDMLLEGALFGTWATNVLLAGTTRKSYTIERAFLDQTVPSYIVYTGCMINTLSLSIKPNDIVTGSFSFMGQTGVASTTATSTTPTAATVNDPFNAFSGSIMEGIVGGTGGTAVQNITGLDITMTNNLDVNSAIGSNIAVGVTPGRFEVTGSVKCFFEDLTLMNKFLAETVSGIEYTLGGAKGAVKTLTTLFGSLKYSDADAAVNGDGTIDLTMPFTAYYDATVNSAAKITRVP